MNILIGAGFMIRWVVMAGVLALATIATIGVTANPPKDERAVNLIKAICDHLSGSLTNYGRPDPDRTRFATQAPWRDLASGPTFHAVPHVALALYQAGRRLKCPAYTRGADVSVLYMISVTRDPYGGERDVYCEYAAEFIKKQTGADVRSQAVHLMSRCWMPGISLDILCRGF